MDDQLWKSGRQTAAARPQGGPQTKTTRTSKSATHKSQTATGQIDTNSLPLTLPRPRETAAPRREFEMLPAWLDCAGRAQLGTFQGLIVTSTVATTGAEAREPVMDLPETKTPKRQQDTAQTKDSVGGGSNL